MDHQMADRQRNLPANTNTHYIIHEREELGSGHIVPIGGAAVEANNWEDSRHRRLGTTWWLSYRPPIELLLCISPTCESGNVVVNLFTCQSIGLIGAKSGQMSCKFLQSVILEDSLMYLVPSETVVCYQRWAFELFTRYRG